MEIHQNPNTRSERERVVILGGLGFIGSHICRSLNRQNYSVRIFDKEDQPHDLVKDLEHVVEIIPGNISRPEEVVKALNDATIVINLIHTTVPGSSMIDPGNDIVSNVANTVRWLEHLNETKLRRIVYFSSGGTVYGVPESTPITEDHPTNPLNSYGITKLAIEKYTALYANRFGIDYCVLRPSNVYGPGQRLHHGQGVIGIMINRALNGDELEIWGKGTDQRDYLFVDDLVDAVSKLVEYKGPQRVFNVSRGIGNSVLDLVTVLRDQINPLLKVKHLPDRGFDVPVNILDSGRLREETGWQPRIGFEEGVLRTIEWIRSHPQTSRLG